MTVSSVPDFQEKKAFHVQAQQTTMENVIYADTNNKKTANSVTKLITHWVPNKQRVWIGKKMSHTCIMHA